MDTEKGKLIRYLSQFVNDERLPLFHQVLEKRTTYITVVLEDIYQTQNASAVLRTCDCFGLQNVHIVENTNRFKVNAGVTLGSTKWLTLHRYNKLDNNTPDALKKLKAEGYRIVATIPDQAAVSLDEFDLSAGKTALVFGSEKPGISSVAASMADEFLTVPMVGFTESLNVSVTAATILYQLTGRLRRSDIDWRLSQEEHEEVLLKWLRRQIKRCELLEKHYFRELNMVSKGR
jgi:tRNA (guanosine-2'-O-)-methyltransferase